MTLFLIKTLIAIFRHCRHFRNACKLKQANKIQNFKNNNSFKYRIIWDRSWKCCTLLISRALAFKAGKYLENSNNPSVNWQTASLEKQKFTIMTDIIPFQSIRFLLLVKNYFLVGVLVYSILLLGVSSTMQSNARVSSEAIWFSNFFLALFLQLRAASSACSWVTKIERWIINELIWLGKKLIVEWMYLITVSL